MASDLWTENLKFKEGRCTFWFPGHFSSIGKTGALRLAPAEKNHVAQTRRKICRR